VTNSTKCRILYADDDSDDQLFLHETLSSCNLPADMVCVNNGEEAISYLEHTPAAQLPALIILDLNMPKLDGRQTLDYIKAKPGLAGIPVIILTTSDNAVEKKECTQSGADYFFSKPQNVKGYQNLVQYFRPYMARCS
jgi:CheY-like chemotaxis protein